MRAGDEGVSLLGPAGAVVEQLPLLSLAGWQAGGGTLQLALTDGTLWQLACAAATEVYYLSNKLSNYLKLGI